MAKVGWWDGDWARTTAINDQSHMLDALDQSSLGMAESVQKLFQLDRRQGRDIARLEAKVEVLLELLVEAGTPREEIARRLEAKFPAQEKKTEESGSSALMVTCASCQQEVPANGTFFTETGEVCDACYAS